MSWSEPSKQEMLTDVPCLSADREDIICILSSYLCAALASKAEGFSVRVALLDILHRA